MIYFAQLGDAGPIKIGYSKDPERRLQVHQGSLPWELRLLATIDGTPELETTLHWHFALERMRSRRRGRWGEWFAPSERLLAFIEQAETLDVEQWLEDQSQQAWMQKWDPLARLAE